MQNSNEKQNQNVTKQEASYGGSRYMRNYDKYKEDSAKSDPENGQSASTKVTTVIAVVVFAALLVFLSLFVMNTILQTKGMNLISLFNPQTPADVPATEAATEKGPDTFALLSETVSIETVSTEGHKNGYGVILSDDGYIVTSSGLVSGALTLSVKFGSGTVIPAYAVGLDEENGISVIKADAKGLHSAKLGDYSKLGEGDRLHLLDIKNNKLFSLILAEAEDAQTDHGYKSIDPSFFKDAVLDFECWPVVTSSNEVVAVACGNKLILINEVLPSINRMMNSGAAMLDTEQGTVAIDRLGITVRSVTSELSSIYNIPEGCFVVYADIASLVKKGDIIVAVDGTPVTDGEALLTLPSAEGGKLTVYRTNGYIEINY